MPYIHKVYRNGIEAGVQPSTPGELTYTLFKLCRTPHAYDGLLMALDAACLKYLQTANPPRFQIYAEILGSITATVCELSRRGLATSELQTTLGEVARSFYEIEVGPYEQKKLEANGDVR